MTSGSVPGTHVLLAAGLVGQSRGREGARRRCLCKEALLCALPHHPDAELYCCGRTCQGWQSGSIEKPSYKINALCRGSHLSDVGFWAVKRIKAIDEEWNLVQVVCKSFSENPMFLCMQKSSHSNQLCNTPLIMKVLCIFSKSHMSFVGSLKLAVACRYLPDTSRAASLPSAPQSAGEKSYVSLARVIWVSCPKTVNPSWTSICICVINQKNYLAVPNICKVAAIP